MPSRTASVVVCLDVGEVLQQDEKASVLASRGVWVSLGMIVACFGSSPGQGFSLVVRSGWFYFRRSARPPRAR